MTAVSNPEAKQALRTWILEKNGKIQPEQLADDTPIIDSRIITSIQVMDLILFLEQLRGEPVDVNSLKPGVFRDINTIVATFIEPGTV